MSEHKEGLNDNAQMGTVHRITQHIRYGLAPLGTLRLKGAMSYMMGTLGDILLGDSRGTEI